MQFLGEAGREKWELLFNGYEVSVRQDEKILGTLIKKYWDKVPENFHYTIFTKHQIEYVQWFK